MKVKLIINQLIEVLFFSIMPSLFQSHRFFARDETLQDSPRVVTRHSFYSKPRRDEKGLKLVFHVCNNFGGANVKPTS